MAKTQHQADDEWLRRKKKIRVKEAADLAGISEDGFRRHYPHLIKQITPRRQGVELGDAIDLPPPPAPTP